MLHNFITMHGAKKHKSWIILLIVQLTGTLCYMCKHTDTSPSLRGLTL